MRKKIISMTVLAIAVLLCFYFFIPEGQSKKNVYYQSGEFLIQGDRQILMVPNGREIEFLEIAKNDKLIKLREINALGDPYNALIRENQTGTYAIVLEGDFVVQYDISDLSQIKVVKKMGPYWKHYDYYYDIAPFRGNRFLTAGEKGITIWNADTLTVMEKAYEKKTRAVESYNESIYAISDEGAIIFNAEREKIIDPYIRIGEHRHQIFVNDEGIGYFPGDDALKLRTYTSYKNMPHPSPAGNAAAGFNGIVYFANGWDVYKLDKDLNLIKNITASRKSGEWSSGLKTVDLDQGKRVIVFNGSDILLLNEDLKILDEYSYTPSNAEILSSKTMKISPRHGGPKQPVMVAGSGFWPGETVNLYVGVRKYELRANDAGDVFKMAEVPEDAKIGKTNILMSGTQSGFSHSAVFEIQE